MITTAPYRYSNTIGVDANNGRGFKGPVDMVFGLNGIIYVLNRGGAESETVAEWKRITMCTLDEDYLGEFSHGGTADGQMMWPTGIAVDQEGNLYVSDEALHRISIFSKDGEFLSKWGVQGAGDGEFDRPAGIVFDSNGNLLVVDGMNCRIQKYSKDGKYLSGWGHPGSGYGEFNVPWGIALDHSENVYVADWRNDRIQKFDSNGNFLLTLGSSGGGDGEFNRPAGVAVDNEGNIYVADWGNERVQVFDSNGRFIAKFMGESGLSKWAKDYFISNQDELEERLKSDMEPEVDSSDDYLRDQSASVEKLFWGPTNVKIDSQGKIYVLDSCRQRIQIYEKTGS